MTILTTAVLLGLVPATATAKPKPKQCVVPNLTGLTTQAAAQEKLAKAHCRVGTVHAVEDAPGRPVLVSLQSPKAGKHYKAGTPVSIWFKLTPVAPTSLTGTQTVYDLNGHPLTVTISSVIDPATGVNEFETPDAGDRFVAVDLQLADPSSATISDDANNDVSIIGSDSQAYTPDFDSVSECTNFDYGDYTLTQDGATEDGCVVFQLPIGVNVQQVQFTLDNGVADFDS